MDTTDMDAALKNALAATSSREVLDGGSDEEWDSARVLAHLTAANRGINELVARILAGAESPPFTNRGALSGPYLDAIVSAAGGPAGVAREFERSSQELVATCKALDESALEREIEAAFWEADGVIFEGRIPLAQLLNGILPGHVAGHVQQFAEA